MKKIIKILFGLIAFSFLLFLLSRGHVYDKKELSYGVTFSKKQAEALGLDWKKTYLDMLYDLGVKKIRLSAYWNEIEPTPGEYKYDDLDWQIDEANKAGAKIILAVGGRLPRWPECHFPDWIKDQSKTQREDKIIEYLTHTINHYKNRSEIIAWQIENEPFLSHFGDCPELDGSFLDREISLARGLDRKPIVVTDSGELSLWVFAAKRADIFGTTMYLNTYSSRLKRYIHYPILPGFFRFKKNIANLFAHPQDWIVIEMAAEPWGPKPFQELSAEERSLTMDLDKFKDMLEFSRQAGFKEFYLWGVEWWAWERDMQNNPALWEEAKRLFIKK